MQAAVVVSHASIVVPFVLGGALSLWLYLIYLHQGVPFTSFALFMGAAMAITAFPVLAIILAATVGKFGGTLIAARVTGLGWRESAALGTLMNTRGLMELIVLNIGLDLGVIGPTLFAMMVVMALVTTGITAPVLHFLLPGYSGIRRPITE